jgi:putative transposase
VRRPRLLAPESFSHAVYHCVSRVVDRRKIFQEAEKEQFVRYMRLYEQLCGLRILTYCIMSNHFHILVEVPRRPEVLPTDGELIALIRETHGQRAADDLGFRFDRWRQQGNPEAIAKERERWFARMWDLASFMKVLKQRFSQWYNRHQAIRRTGTLWEDRYRSVLVENGQALQTMATYIDLNSVRAGLAADPKDYRWCGYGEACAGRSLAQAGLARVARTSSRALADFTHETPDGLRGVLGWYRQELFGRGSETFDVEGNVVRRGFSDEDIQASRDAQGRLPAWVYIHLRVRYFTDGAVLGTKAFVEAVFQARRQWFSSNRQSGSRRLQGLELNSPLRVARALAVQPYG